MSETSAEQVSFGWAGETPVEAGQGRPPSVAARPAPPPVPGGYVPGEAGRGSQPTRMRRRSVSAPDALPPDNELWDVHAAARFLRRSVSWVYHRAEDGTLPVKRIGGWGLRFIPAELRAWVEASGTPRRMLGKGGKD